MLSVAATKNASCSERFCSLNLDGDRNYPLNQTNDWDMIISSITNRKLQLP
jgi:hypothetical protein